MNSTNCTYTLHTNTDLHIPASPVLYATSHDPVPPDNTETEETDKNKPAVPTNKIVA